MVEFDEWGTTSVSKTQQIPTLEYVSESLMKRARQRVEDVRRVAVGWNVNGNKKFGDKYPDYLVTRDPETGKLWCTCYTTSHGETRARRMCSHVVAVELFRQGEDVLEGAENDADGLSSRVFSSSSNAIGLGDRETTSIDIDTSSAFGEVGISTPSPTLSPVLSVAGDVDSNEWGQPHLPEKFTSIFSHQYDAVIEACELFDAGKKVVFLDAPTGSGKTFIAELIRRKMKQRSAYVCSSLTLMDQFLNDFHYAKLLKGRANYPTLDYPYPDYTCADCTGSGEDSDCEWCFDYWQCPYQKAKSIAKFSPLAVTNTAYYMHETYYGRQYSTMRGKGLVIVDECDTLESMLMGFVDFQLSERQAAGLKVDVPKPKSHKTTILEWMQEDLQEALKREAQFLGKGGSRGIDVQTLRRRRAIVRMLDEVDRISIELSKDSDAWVRDNSDALILRPVKVNTWGEEVVWSTGKKWLCMSATIISPDEMVESLGYDGDWGLVRVPMTFPKENRPIYVCPVANMTQKEKEVERPKMVEGIAGILRLYPNDRILIHTVSYDLARYLKTSLRSSRTVTYTDAGGREGALSEYRRRPNGVLLASSMDRGVDLAGDDCRAIVVAKVPFPNLGNPQVNTRQHMEGGQTWYAVQTIRSLVQMTGRGVRNQRDWCHTFILDKQFLSKIWKGNRNLLPDWWKDAVDLTYDVRQLVKR